jgi:hypothetical protein
MNNVTLDMVEAWMYSHVEIPPPIAKFLLQWDMYIQDEVDVAYNRLIEKAKENQNMEDVTLVPTLVKFTDDETYRKYTTIQDKYMTAGAHNKLVDRVQKKLMDADITAFVIDFDNDDYISFLENIGHSHSNQSMLAWLYEKRQKLFDKMQTEKKSADNS